MKVQYEKLEEFIDDMKNEAGTEKPIYITIVKSQDQSGMLYTKIVVQYIDANGTAWTYSHDDIPSIRILDDGVFDLMFDDIISRQAKEQHRKEKERVQIIAKQEYDKFVEIFKRMGFTNFRSAIIT